MKITIEYEGIELDVVVTTSMDSDSEQEILSVCVCIGSSCIQVAHLLDSRDIESILDICLEHIATLDQTDDLYDSHKQSGK